MNNNIFSNRAVVGNNEVPDKGHPQKLMLLYVVLLSTEVWCHLTGVGLDNVK